MKHFDYYIFIDYLQIWFNILHLAVADLERQKILRRNFLYSENLIGYTILETKKINELLPKISRFRHYKDARQKKLYLKNIKNTFKRENLLSYFLKCKIRSVKDTLEIFMDVGEFIKFHANCLIFISVDDKQYLNFEKLVKFVDGESIKVVKESQLKEYSPEYKISLVLDNLLNIERLKNETL